MPPLSSPNLIANAGFALAEAGGPHSWQTQGSASLVETLDVDDAGLPHASRAVRLSQSDRIRQTVALPNAERQRYAFRLVGRASEPDTTFSIAIDTAGMVIASHTFTVGSKWSRCRFEVEIDSDRETSVTVEIAGPDIAGPNVQITDVRMVALYDTGLGGRAPFPIRFVTRGDFGLPSSRLRAYLMADYLDLIGWPASVNEDGRADLVVFQKVRRWGLFMRSRLAGAASLFDLDDNEVLRSRRWAIDIRLFSGAVDGITAGSEFLLERMTAWNNTAFLLDNMVDVLDADIRRDNRPWQGRLVWFGMPENAWCVDGIAAGKPVTRITRGGDIEFHVKTIDRHLTEFDLALLPMPLNEATKAKNGNRLVKCAALGLPVLASDTPENRRAAARLGIADTVLVKDDEDWRTRIDAAAANYGAFCAEMSRARDRALAIYGREQIVADWLRFCADLVTGKMPA
ncbi:MAG: glycosyltransferase [Hyphomicrobiales bacterium]|nr:glycosyltransferase [Hyphomicrobiales bacterium]